MKAQRQIEKLCKKRETLNSIFIEGRVVLSRFWEKAWCKHLEKVKDQNYCLERGRRSNSVIDLAVKDNTVRARIRGSSNYGVRVKFFPVSHDKWQKIVSHLTGKIDPLVSLLKRSFLKGVMTQIENRLRKNSKYFHVYSYPKISVRLTCVNFYTANKFNYCRASTQVSLKRF